MESISKRRVKMTIKKVYLTIDDSPSKDFKEKIDYLYDRKIPAVFFCVGENMIEYEEEMVYAIKKGFLIGNHSLKHRYFSDMDLDTCYSSILETDEIIEKMYDKSGVKRPMKLFRFPHFDQGGDESSKHYENKWSKPQNEWADYPQNDKRLKLQRYLRDLGYVQPEIQGIDIQFFADKLLLEGVDVRCTFDQMEYFFGQDDAPYGMGDEQVILHRIDEDIPYMGRSLNCHDTSDIILVHDHEYTTPLFYKIINRYVEKGFQFMSL